MWRVVVEKGFSEGQAFELAEGETIVGRSSECGIRLAALDISRRHLRLTVREGRLSAENLSSHGTRLNGANVAALTALSDGHRLQIGMATVLRVERVGERGGADVRRAAADAAGRVTAAGVPGGAVHGSPQVSRSKPSAAGVASIGGGGGTADPTVKPDEPDESACQAKPEASRGGPAVDDVGDFASDGSLLIRASDADVDEPVSLENVRGAPVVMASMLDSGVQVVAHREDAAADDFDFDSQDSIPVGGVVGRDESYEFREESSRAKVDDWASMPTPEDEGGHTQPMSPEAVKFLRQVQERRERRRKLIVIGVVVVVLLALFITIMMW